MFTDTKAFSSFSVNDIPAARAFYGDTLGLKVTEMQGLLHLETISGHQVMVYPKDDHTPASFTVLNFAVDDIESAVDDLTRRGITFERYPQYPADDKGIVRGDMPPIAWFTDPAGNVLSVVQEPF